MPRDRAIKVILHDVEQDALDRGARHDLEKPGSRSREKQDHRCPTRSDGYFAESLPTTDIGSLAEADFIIEAVVEDFELKSKVFKLWTDRPSRCHTGFEYVFDFDHEDRIEDAAARTRSSACTS